MKLFMVKSRYAFWRKGFTIVELMVVVAIIAILAAISIVTYHNVQANANDKVRAADVSAIMNALEKYYQQNGEYPADNVLNPTYSPTRLANFTAVKTAMPSLSDEALNGPGDYQFYASCFDVDCTNSSTNWQTYMTKSYRYQSRDSRVTTPGSTFPKSVAASYGTNTGWGCTVTTTLDDPGYAIAWYSEAQKIWIFKKSAHGTVTIASYGSGPVAPQTCAFS